MTHPVMSHVGSNVGQSYSYLGVPPEMTGYRKGLVPKKPGDAAKTSKNEKTKETKREDIPGKTKKESNDDKNTKVCSLTY